MSVREFSPLFSWGFSLRRSKWLVPLFSNNIVSIGSGPVSASYGNVDYDGASSSDEDEVEVIRPMRQTQRSPRGASMTKSSSFPERVDSRPIPQEVDPRGSRSIPSRKKNSNAAPAPVSAPSSSSSSSSSSAPSSSSSAASSSSRANRLPPPPTTPDRTMQSVTTSGGASTKAATEQAHVSRSENISEEEATRVAAEAEVRKAEQKERAAEIAQRAAAILKRKEEENLDTSDLSDEEIVVLLHARKILGYALEKEVGDLERAVKIRRDWMKDQMLHGFAMEEVPYQHFDYSLVLGACCENVIGYVPLPLGLAGPVKVNDENVIIPMATTEGCLVASTHRGCKAINESGGASAFVTGNGITRGPALQFPSATRAVAFKAWIDSEEGFDAIKNAFDSTSRFARLESLKVGLAGRKTFVRFKAVTGDAMGMNMITKGVNEALKRMSDEFGDMELLSVSGNYCVDKKPSAMNWIEGRGKSVVCEAFITAAAVESVLKTTVDKMVELNITKNLIGSAMAGSIGGFNAHASNILTAMYIACGQDPAQNVESSTCMTLMEKTLEGDLYVSCTMPSVEVGTVGGGTHLPAQKACLEMLGVKGANPINPGDNACKFATYVCCGVLAGELSLMAALTTNDLIRSHLRLNRSSSNLSLSSYAGTTGSNIPSPASSSDQVDQPQPTTTPVVDSPPTICDPSAK